MDTEVARKRRASHSSENEHPDNGRGPSSPAKRYKPIVALDEGRSTPTYASTINTINFKNPNSNQLWTGTPRPRPMPKVVSVDKLDEDLNIEAGYRFFDSAEDLGAGGFSKVKLARHKMTGQRVAIKCMDKRKLGADLCRVKTEVNALKALRGHPSICSLYQVLESTDRIYLVLELIEGGELFDHIVSKVRLPEHEASAITKQLLSVLAYIHSRGFAHRDLKPENILLSGPVCICGIPHIKLIDFGLCADSESSKLADGSRTHINALSTCCGSPAYAAPELLCLNENKTVNGSSTYSGPLVDVWSLGVISYALMIGRLPFDHENLSQLYRQIKAGLKPSQLPPWLSERAKSFLMSCLKTDPSKRCTVAELLKHPFIMSVKGECSAGSSCAQLKSQLVDGSVLIQSQFDEEVITRVSTFFPQLTFREIRSRLTNNGLDYVSATYYLYQSKLSSLNARISARKSISSAVCSPTPRTVRKASPDTPMTEAVPKIVVQPPRKSLVPTVPARMTPTTPRVAGVTNKRQSINTPLQVRTPLSPRSNEVKNYIATPKVSAISEEPRKTPSKVPGAGLGDSLNSSKGGDSTRKRPPLASLPTTPVKKRESLSAPVTPVKKSTPLKATPGTVTPSKTPGTSLFKRLIGLSSHKKNHHESVLTEPRTLSSDKEAKNIVQMSGFTSPTAAICALEHMLSGVGIKVTKKDPKNPFLLSCARGPQNKFTSGHFSGSPEVTFVLELCYFSECRALCIQRRRLRGSSWSYKKVCEEILHLCNSLPSQNESTTGDESGNPSSAHAAALSSKQQAPLSTAF